MITYYVILPEEMFNAPIPDMVKEQMLYPENYIVKDCIFGIPEQLENGKWLCDARFRSYYNYKANENDLDVIGISNNSTNRFLNDDEVAQWKAFIGEENIIINN